MQISTATTSELPQFWDLLTNHLPNPQRTDLRLHLQHLFQIGKLTTDDLLVARAGQPVGVLLWQRHRDRTATLWPPRLVESETGTKATDIADALISERLRQSDRLGLRLVLSFLDPADPTNSIIFARHQFRRTTHLRTLQTQVFEALRGTAAPTEATSFQLYPVLHPAGTDFSTVLLATYQDTCDCPELEGRRSAAEVLAGYRDACQRPLWFRIVAAQRTVGVLLLATDEEPVQWQLVYLGLIPSMRGRGLGTCVLAEAFRWAARQRVQAMQLIVDVRNHPALRLYQRFGFHTVEERALWMRP